MKVTVVVPVKNEEKMLPRCIGSLLEQATLPNEIIVVDNNSQDRTFTVAQSYKEEFRKRGVQLVPMSCVHGNQIEARTLGFNSAKHEIIVTIDADTRLQPDWIAHAARLFEEQPDVAGAGGPFMYDNKILTAAFGLLLWFYRCFPKRYFFFGSNGAFRKSAYTQTTGLQGCREIMEKENFQEPYDDLYLSFVLKQAGRVIPARSLRAAVISRSRGERASTPTALKRLVRQLYESIKLQNILLRRNQRATISRMKK